MTAQPSIPTAPAAGPLPRALVVGAFGQDNPGDEALLAATIAAVRRHGWNPVVATARPAETTARHEVESVAATAWATARAALQADALVVGGGTVFKELHPSTGRARGALLRNALLLTRAVRARGGTVALVGVGAAPIGRALDRRLARSLAHRADLLVLRDARSAQLLADMGVPAPLRVGADLSWTVLDPAPSRRAAADAPLGVALSHLAGGDTVVDALGDALASVATTGRRIELEPWQGSPRLGPDGRLATQLARRIGPLAQVVPPPADLQDAVRRDADRAAVVALRFHAAVAAAHSGTPFLAVAHEPKLDAVAARLGQPAVGVAASASAIASGIEAVLAGPPPSARAVEQERRRARAVTELLGFVLTGGGHGDLLSHLSLVPAPVPE